MDPTAPLSGQWMWHPNWTEEVKDSAGMFVHFRTGFELKAQPTHPVMIRISADTKYKLYVNSNLVGYGPVKGDSSLWFYDQLDIRPYLRPGPNHIAVRVLRLFHATQYATSFPRLSSPGLYFDFLQALGPLHTPETTVWETALDMSTILPVDLAEDDFLHTYESVDNSKNIPLQWYPVKPLNFPSSHGLSPPWKLSPRMIPHPRLQPATFISLHNIRSVKTVSEWEQLLLGTPADTTATSLRLPAGTSHHIELEASAHLTAFLSFHFRRPAYPGSVLKITYSECYEDEPIQIPYLRSKQNRCDTQKHLLGPQDTYIFGGERCIGSTEELEYDIKRMEHEIFTPFHYRTLRFLSLDIQVNDSEDLLFERIDMVATNYAFDLKAEIDVHTDTSGVEPPYRQIWDTSIRTLVNCMHDCYEDCPFYEQLQYAMDTRSSILFTYYTSCDDRLARQAIIQLHNSYQPEVGLTASRAPSHQLQLIPHFSLFWVAMVADHFEHFADTTFTRQFIAACDGVLEHFARRLDPDTALVRSSTTSNLWEFVDWTDDWRPMGIPSGATRTGFCTFTNMLYAYTLKLAAQMLTGIQRPALASEYLDRASSVVTALRKHCFDGKFFTDSLSHAKISPEDYSEHSQIWAVLCGAIEGQEAADMLENTLYPDHSITSSDSSHGSIAFTPVSTAMSFYKLRALSLVGGTLYDKHFHRFWTPWKEQLSLNLSTWEEDSVSHRSDCHAWGCAPLYEFTAEVAGIRPGKAGWEMIDFCPRPSVFSTVDIKVPFGGPYGSGVARVKWHVEGNGDVVCSLTLKMNDLAQSKSHSSSTPPPPVRMLMPNGQIEEIQNTSEEIVRVINPEKKQRAFQVSKTSSD